MTGKEAARRSWETVSAKSAGLFVIGGIAAIAAGKYVDGADWATLYGYAMGAWGVAQSLMERTAKRTGSEVTSQVWQMFGEHKALISQGEKDHAACETQHAGHVVELGLLRRDVNHLAGAMEEVKPGWKLAGGHE